MFTSSRFRVCLSGLVGLTLVLAFTVESSAQQRDLGGPKPAYLSRETQLKIVIARQNWIQSEHPTASWLQFLPRCEILSEVFGNLDARVPVSPAADKAGELLSQSRFAEAARVLQDPTADISKDAYALYLLAICQAELGQSEESAATFRQVLAVEPQATSARLLEVFLDCAAQHSEPLPDMVFVDCCDRGVAAAEAHFTDHFHANNPLIDNRVLGAGGFPKPLLDPVIARLDALSRNGRGPLSFDIEKLASAGLASDDPAEFAVGWLLTPDYDKLSTIADRFANARNAVILDALFFAAVDHLEAWDSASIQETRPAALARLRKAAPQNGRWIVLELSGVERDPESDEYPVLTSDDLKNIERAVAAPQWCDFAFDLRAAIERLARDQGVMCPATCRDLLWGATVAERTVVYRFEANVKQMVDANRSEDARRTAALLGRFAARCRNSAMSSGDFTAMLAATVFMQRAAELAAMASAGSDCETWRRSMEGQLESRRRMAAASEIYTRLIAGMAAPLPRLANRGVKLLDDFSEPNGEKLFQHYASSEAEEHSPALAYAIADNESASVRHITMEGIYRRRANLGALQAHRKMELSPEQSWALIWTLAELKDDASVDWLITILEGDSDCLKPAAAAALTNITGKDLGTNAAAWRAAVKTG